MIEVHHKVDDDRLSHDLAQAVLIEAASRLWHELKYVMDSATGSKFKVEMSFDLKITEMPDAAP